MVVEDSEVDVPEVVILLENANGDVGIGQGSSVGADKDKITEPGALGKIIYRVVGVVAVQGVSVRNVNK